MKILVVSVGDACRSRIAASLLLSFGRGMTVFTAGIAEESQVFDIVGQVVEEKGHEFSYVKPVPVIDRAHESWDYVITLCQEAEDTLNSMHLKATHWAHLYFDDPMKEFYSDEENLKEAVISLYEEMDQALYHFYRDELSEYLMPRCTCGANTFCRCE